MRLRVRTKLLLSVVFIISVVLGTSTYLQLQSSRKNYLQALEWRSEALAAPILELLATRYLFDAESIQKSLGDAANTCQKIYEANKKKTWPLSQSLLSTGRLRPIMMSAFGIRRLRARS